MTARGEEKVVRRSVGTPTHPAVLQGGFRPFFFAGAVWAVVALALWLFALTGGLQLPSAFSALAWHLHEILFGSVGAAVAGFLLTAIPNWTGRPPLAGKPLALLFGIWLAARLALMWSGFVGLGVAATLDIGFYLALAVVAAREVLVARNRNLPVVGLIFLFGLANALDYAGFSGVIEDTEAGFRAAIALVVTMISLIGGRIVPTFTRNWMVKRSWTRRLPVQSNRFDLATMASTALALLGWVLAPAAVITGMLLIIAGLLQLARVARWAGWRTLSDPLVAILHLAYLWIPTGLLLLAASILDSAIPRTAAIHALTAGAMATMILAVMTRATLGHTGRELRASPATVVLYLLVTVGAIVRVAAALGLIPYRLGLDTAATCWGGAFVVFLVAYGPYLLRPRVRDSG